MPAIRYAPATRYRLPAIASYSASAAGYWLPATRHPPWPPATMATRHPPPAAAAAAATRTATVTATATATATRYPLPATCYPLPATRYPPQIHYCVGIGSRAKLYYYCKPRMISMGTEMRIPLTLRGRQWKCHIGDKLMVLAPFANHALTTMMNCDV